MPLTPIPDNGRMPLVEPKMPLETGTYISDLNSANPAGGDQALQGDDHLRLIKSTVKATFPNITGAVTGTHTRLNAVTGQFTDAGLLQAANGAVGGPSISFASDPTSGFYRIAANDYGFAVAGSKTVELTAAGTHVLGTLTVDSTATLSAAVTVGTTLGVTGVATFTATPVFSAGIGSATATTQSTADSSTKVATTAYVQNNLVSYATLASPTLTGDPKAPTPSAGDNDTSIATTAFVTTATLCVAKAVGKCTLTVSTVAGTTSSQSSSVVQQSTAHGLSSGDIIWTVTGTLPTGWTSGAAYYVGVTDSTHYKLYTTLAGALAVDGSNVTLTGTCSGSTIIKAAVSVTANVGLASNPFQFTCNQTNVSGTVTVGTAFSTTGWMPILGFNANEAFANNTAHIGVFAIRTLSTTAVTYDLGTTDTSGKRLWNDLNSGQVYYISFQGYAG